MSLISILVSLPKSHLKSSWLALREVIVLVLSYICFFYLFLFAFPFLIYRKFVTVVVKIKDPEVTKCVTGLSVAFLRDFDCFHEKSLHSIVICLRIKGGALTHSLLKQSFMEKVVLKKEPITGQLCYPELQQFYMRFMGYSFLKRDLNFDIDNHVTVHRDESEVVVTRALLMELWQNLLSKPFPKGRSPWEAILVENYLADEREEEGERAPDWIVFIRLHHGIADGYCLAKIISSLLDSDYSPDFVSLSSLTKAGHKNKSVAQQIQNLFISLRSLLMGPYTLMNRGFRFAEDYHALHFPATDKSNEYFIVESDMIEVKKVKEIKSKLRVGLTTVLLAVMSGAIRRFLLKNAMPVPERLSITMPFPVPGSKRADKLGLENEFLLAHVYLPVDLDDQQARLFQIQRDLESLRHSGFMTALNIFINLVTFFPSPIVRAVTKKSIFSTCYSSIPGPDKLLTGGLRGCDVIDINSVNGLSPDSLGLAICSLTYAGNMRMVLNVERNLMGGSRKKAEQFVECLMEEYMEIKTLALR